MFQRTLQLSDLMNKKSFFLFGPRGTGKSFLIRETLSDRVVLVNLLKASDQLRLMKDPGLLEEVILERSSQYAEKPVLVVIDEVQKIPILLDEVHRLIEEKKWRFLLTGSSARRLKNGGANLLAGRAWLAELFPLTFFEMPNFQLERYLRFGGLPAVVLSDEPEEQLDAYVQTYLNEEIKGESVVRKIPAFVEFLRLAALSNTQLINFASLARDAGVSPPTVAGYFQILEDTLIGFQVLPWRKSTQRKSVSTAKFYFFDTGVVNTLAGTRHVDRNSNLFGQLFEHWIALELRAYISYRRNRASLHFWRTEEGHEVDFILGEQIAIEVKSTTKVGDADLKSLKILQQSRTDLKEFIVVSQDQLDRQHQGIQILHWKTFLNRLWDDKIQLSGP